MIIGGLRLGNGSKVPRVVERADLVVDNPAVVEVAVELRSVETEDASNGGVMATEALTLGGIIPNLVAQDAAVIDGEGVAGPFRGHEAGIGGRGPAVGNAVSGAETV